MYIVCAYFDDGLVIAIHQAPLETLNVEDVRP